jgi:Fe-S cluster assembly iron-binding protein IscA
MGLVLDEPADNDVVFNENGVKIVVEKAIISKVGGVRIHARPNRYVGTEFRVTPWSQPASEGNH